MQGIYRAPYRNLKEDPGPYLLLVWTIGKTSRGQNEVPYGSLPAGGSIMLSALELHCVRCQVEALGGFEKTGPHLAGVLKRRARKSQQP